MPRSFTRRSEMMYAQPPMPAGVPWIARERRSAHTARKAVGRTLFALVLTLFMNAIAFAEPVAPTPAPTSPDAMPTLQPTPPATASRARTAPAPSAVQSPAPVLAVQPDNLRHVEDWQAFRQARHIASLPSEARLFYRRGLTARQAGQMEESLVNVRGAADLDPTFIQPHLTLAAWMLFSDPSQALLQYSQVLEQLRQNFNLQLSLATNILILTLEAIFVGLLMTALLVLWMRREEWMHPWQEQLAAFGSPEGAVWWGRALLVLPFVAGFGLTLPCLALMGYLWPVLRMRERTLFVALALFVISIPFGLRGIERLSMPLHENSGPFYGVTTLENAPYTQQRAERLASLAAANPDNALLQFGLAWTARRGGDLPTAETSYRRALQLWPGDPRVLTNLGNVLAMQGRTKEALDCYAQAVERDPANAAALFNQSQLYTQRFEYAAATQALTRASALNFELVKSYQSQATSDGLLPLADRWLDPSLFWKALRTAPLPANGPSSIPMGLRQYHETSGWAYSALAIVLAAIGFWFGLRAHRLLPLRTCSNCARTVCRRCAERRREHALCPDCARLEAQAETHEFARVLLLRHRQQLAKRQGMIRTAISALIPGYGLVSHRRVFTPAILIALSWVFVRAWLGVPMPYSIEPRLTLPGQEVPGLLLVVGMALVYVISLLGYISLNALEVERESHMNAGMRGRITQSTRRNTAHAA